jgi:hypothetical protein
MQMQVTSTITQLATVPLHYRFLLLVLIGTTYIFLIFVQKDSLENNSNQ